MADQESAWDAGDIPGFMEAYSDTICFISSRGRTLWASRGNGQLSESYPDRSVMGDLKFNIHEVLPAGDPTPG